jgi:hypothetical protein
MCCFLFSLRGFTVFLSSVSQCNRAGQKKRNYLYYGELEYICAKNIYVIMHVEKYKYFF